MNDDSVQQMGTIEFSYQILMMSLVIVAVMIYLVYFVAHYAHPEDTSFGKSFFARAMIYIGYFICFSLILAVQFDIFLTQNGVKFRGVYYAIQTIQLLYVFALGPALMVYYESNENLPIAKRLLNSFRIQVPTLITLGLLVCMSYFVLNDYSLNNWICKMYKI